MLALPPPLPKVLKPISLKVWTPVGLAGLVSMLWINVRLISALLSAFWHFVIVWLIMQLMFPVVMTLSALSRLLYLYVVGRGSLP